ncbi:hypothetical protein ACLOJK_017642 [Asimina triloba]
MVESTTNWGFIVLLTWLTNQFEYHSVYLPIGLSLERNRAMLDELHEALSQAMKATSTDTDQNQRAKEEMGASKQEIQRRKGIELLQQAEKLKASNIPAKMLEINTWVRESFREGDVVAKCYYARQKLVWEVMEHGLKSKIEIQWSDISAIRATFSDNQPDILEIEVQHVPQFFQETNPEPRKHTLWHPTVDFTRGQASKFRRHRLGFPHGTLGRHYEKLLSCDARQHQENLSAFNMGSSTDSQLPYYRNLGMMATVPPPLLPTPRPFPQINSSHPSPSPFADQGQIVVSQAANQTDQDMSFVGSTSQFNLSFPSRGSQSVMFASSTPRDSQAKFDPNNWQLGETSGQMAGDTSFFSEPNHNIHYHTNPGLGLNMGAERMGQCVEYPLVHMNDYLPKKSEIDETPSATRLLQLQNYQLFAQAALGLSSYHVLEQVNEDGYEDDEQNIP